ncbi:MsnO8 family LLM class oxidoreductase, partial [Nocardia gipuzkoensis]
LPNHQPLVVAEQFGVLESLFPGRIDMGLGRSVGFTGGVRRALGHDRDDADDFDAQLAELLDYLTRGRAGVHAWPTEGLPIPAYLLATSVTAAERAARFGLPLVIAAVRGRSAMVEAIERYRAEFRPTPWGERPYVMVSSTVLIADTEAQARRLLLPEAWAAAASRTRGEFPVLLPPGDIHPEMMTARERDLFEDALRGHIHGTEDTVAEALEDLIAHTAADEILVHTSTYDRTARLESHERLARLVALVPQPTGSVRS